MLGEWLGDPGGGRSLFQDTPPRSLTLFAAAPSGPLVRGAQLKSHAGGLNVSRTLSRFNSKVPIEHIYKRVAGAIRCDADDCAQRMGISEQQLQCKGAAVCFFGGW